MPFPRVLADPMAISVLGASLALAAGVQIVEPWSGRAPWVVGWGLAAYALAAAASFLLRAEARDSHLRAMHAIRRRMLSRLANYYVGGNRPGQPQIVQLRDQTRAAFDEEIMPPLRLLVERRNDRRTELARIEARVSGRPDADFIERLRSMSDADEAALERASQLSANADTQLFSLLESLERGGGPDAVPTWQGELDRVHIHLAEALRPSPPRPFELAAAQTRSAVTEDPPGEDGTHEEIAPAREGPPAEPAPSMLSEDVVRLVSQGLRDLNKTGRLAQSELISLLPRTLRSARATWTSGNSQATPDEQAHALAEVLNTAIDRLKPSDAAASGSEKRQDVHYKILHEEYRLGMSPTHIMVRLEVTDATFFRWRNEAVSAVARELIAREDRLRLRGADDPTAMDYLG